MKTNILPPIFGQIWRNIEPSSRYSEFWNVSVSSNYCINGHNMCDRLGDYWTRAAQFFITFNPNTTWHSTVCYTSFVTCISQTVTKKSSRMTTIMTDWKIKEIFDTGNVMYSKFYKTFGNWRGDFTFQRESLILVIYPSPPQKSGLELKFANSVRLMATHMIWMCT
jgi:hypothetical protein